MRSTYVIMCLLLHKVNHNLTQILRENTWTLNLLPNVNSQLQLLHRNDHFVISRINGGGNFLR